MDREQTKVVTPLRAIANELNINWDRWDSVYARKEQIKRTMLRVSGDVPFSEKTDPDLGMPPQLEKEYATILKAFVPQHPFISGRDFSGPAFRDYCVSFSLTEDISFKLLSRKLFSRASFVPTRLLIQFFLQGDRDFVYGEDVGLLYESFAAADSLSGTSSSLIIHPYSESDPGAHLLELYRGNKDSGTEDLKHTLFVRQIDGSLNIAFPRSLRSAAIELNDTLTIGESGSEFEIRDSQVTAKEIKIKCKALTCQSIRAGEHSTLEATNTHVDEANLTINLYGPGKLNVCWEGSQLYPWSSYHCDPDAQIDPSDTYTVLHALRRILNWFRKDRRTDLARHEDLIHNAAVGKSKIRKAVFDFLLSTGVVYKKAPLYYINLEVARSKGIHWGDIRSGKIADSNNNEFVKNFLLYLNQQPH